MNPVSVIGCCGSGFSEEAREILRGAELVFGGKRAACGRRAASS